MNHDEALNYLMAKYNMSTESAQSAYNEVKSIKTQEEANNWISPWPSYFSGTFAGCERSAVIACGNGFVLENGTGKIRTGQGESLVQRFAWVNPETGRFEVVEQEGGADGGAILIPSGRRSFTSLLMAPRLVDSMFTRLYFFKGHGLRYYDFLREDKQIFGGFGGWVHVWVADWNGTSEIVIDPVANWNIVNSDDSVIVDYIASVKGSVINSTIEEEKFRRITKPFDFDQ